MIFYIIKYIIYKNIISNYTHLILDFKAMFFLNISQAFFCLHCQKWNTKIVF